MVILALDRPAGVALWQCLEHLGGDELGAEERRCRVADGGLQGHCDLFEATKAGQSVRTCPL